MPRGGVCVSEARRELEVHTVSPATCRQASMESVTNPCPFEVFSETSLLLLPASWSSSSQSILWGGKRKMGLFGSITHSAGETRHSLTCSHFPCVRKQILGEAGYVAYEIDNPLQRTTGDASLVTEVTTNWIQHLQLEKYKDQFHPRLLPLTGPNL